MLEPKDALRRILDRLADVAPLPAERVTLREALGRALAAQIRADRPLPPFDNSQMDGCAFRSADVPRAGTRLPIAFDVFAGEVPGKELPPRSCCRITTGAPLPAGADCVEMQEEVSRKGKGAVFRRRGERGRFVRRAGSDLARSAVALERGRPLDPGALGLAAALGHSELPVHRRPRVALLPTGDELVQPGDSSRPGRIVDSNSHALAGACLEAGAIPVLLPPARDTSRSLASALRGARGCDVLVTMGGVSVGERDLVRRALAAAGARLDFWRIAMRPGKPIAFGRWGAAAVFGLPGNPASALVGFELFVRPALRALSGLPGSGRLRLETRLGSAQEKPAGLTVYLRVRVRFERNALWALPLPSQQSGHLTSVTGFDALAVLPKTRTFLGKGARVETILLRPPP